MVPKQNGKMASSQLVLGETWVDHYGTNHKQATGLVIEEAQKEHPVLRWR